MHRKSKEINSKGFEIETFRFKLMFLQEEKPSYQHNKNGNNGNSKKSEKKT